jgi:hypothetical protein
MTEAGYKRMFLIGALWNLAGGAIIVAATNWVFQWAGLQPPSPAVYYYSWIALFLSFGIGYYKAYQDMYRNRDIVLIGAIGKSAFAAVFLYYYIAYPGQVPWFFLIPLVGDLVFVVLFVMFLRFARQRKPV